jgi:N-lysine methyltransferase SETD6
MQLKTAAVEVFEAWMLSVGIKWNSDAISITDTTAATAATMLCSGLALGITAARDITEGDEICPVLPKSACICPLTCSIADILEREDLNSGLGLVIAVMHEASLGADSKWAGYFASMPQREYLPVFWTKEELKALQGTELENSIPEDLENVEDDYNTHVVPLLSTYSGRFILDKCTLQHFHYAASLVASRMFGIDDVHGAGMVPLADVFNHKASVVDLAPEYAVHGEDSYSNDDEERQNESGEEERGEDEEESFDDDASGSGSSEEEEEEEKEEEHDHHHGNTNAALPTVMRKENTNSATNGITADGVHTTTPAVHALHGISKVNGLHLALEIAIIDGGDHLQIVAASDIPAGNEIHNTYGELSNCDLVKKYGFALRYNPFNAVQLKKDDVIDACRELYLSTSGGHIVDEEEKEVNEPAAKKAKKGGGKKIVSKKNTDSEKVFNNLLKILEDETDLLTEEDGEEPFELLPNGHIGPALFATLRVLCSGAENLKNAATSLDDALKVSITTDKEAYTTVLDPGCIKAVQLWPVTDEEGKLLPEKELIEKGASEAAALKDKEKATTDNIDALEASQLTSCMITPAMCTALLDAVQRRLQKYPTTLEETVTQLEKFENEIRSGGKSSCSAEALSEGQTAARAALTLRLTEQEILKGIETAAKMKLKTN